jgi:DNA-binding transcriptional MerR regulator
MPSQHRIGEVAALLGISTKTIRHYHRVGLLAEPPRTAGGYRLYRTRDLILLLRIRRLQQLGLSLAQIRAVLGHPDDDPRALGDVLEQLLAMCDEQIRALQARRARIAALLAAQSTNSGAALDELVSVQTPELLAWAQAQVSIDLQYLKPTIWTWDARVLSLLESFHWPEGHLQGMREITAQLLQQPEAMHHLVGMLERFVALAGEPKDSPQVERLADEYEHSDLRTLLASGAAEQTPPVKDVYGEAMGDILLSALSPAQRRCLGLIQLHMAAGVPDTSGATGG